MKSRWIWKLAGVAQAGSVLFFFAHCSSVPQKGKDLEILSESRWVVWTPRSPEEGVPLWPLREVRGDAWVTHQDQRVSVGVWLRASDTRQSLERFVISASHPFGGTVSSVSYKDGQLQIEPPQALPTVLSALPLPALAGLWMGQNPCARSSARPCRTGKIRVQWESARQDRMLGWELLTEREAWRWRVSEWPAGQPFPEGWQLTWTSEDPRDPHVPVRSEQWLWKWRKH